MSRFVASIVLAFASLVLSSCTAPGPMALMPEGKPTGWVALSLARDLNYSEVTVGIRPVDRSWGGRNLGFTAMNALGKTFHTWGDKKSGIVAAARFTEGRYEITNFRLEYGPGGRVYWSREDFSIPFDVKAGEVVYLGELMATATIMKPVIMTPMVESPYFIWSDQRARDMAIAVRENPALQGLPVRGVSLLGQKATSFIRTTRIPQ